MEEIKVGEYVRTIDGLIYKCTDKIKINSTDYKYIFDKFYEFYIEEDGECLTVFNYINDFEVGEITKHSPNIIELIEVGDILEIEEDGIRGCMGWDKDTTTLSYKDMIEDIKKGEVKLLGIVTHEQFNSIKYEVI